MHGKKNKKKQKNKEHLVFVPSPNFKSYIFNGGEKIFHDIVREELEAFAYVHLKCKRIE